MGTPNPVRFVILKSPSKLRGNRDGENITNHQGRQARVGDFQPGLAHVAGRRYRQGRADRVLPEDCSDDSAAHQRSTPVLPLGLLQDDAQISSADADEAAHSTIHIDRGNRGQRDPPHVLPVLDSRHDWPIADSFWSPRYPYRLIQTPAVVLRAATAKRRAKSRSGP